MKKPLINLLHCLVLAAVVLFPVSCGSDDESVSALDVSGTWRITSTACAELTAVLTHTGTTITGTVTDAASYARGISGSSATAAGAVSGSRDVSLTVTFSDGMWVRFGGVVNNDNTRISGTYFNSQANSDPFIAQRQ